MSTARFVIAFDGPGVEAGTIDVRDLAPALLALSKAVDAANRTINGDAAPAHIQVKATTVGCFEVDLNLVLHGWAAIKGLLLTEDGQAATSLLQWLGFLGIPTVGVGAMGLIQLYRKLNGRAMTAARQEGSLVTITVVDGGFFGTATEHVPQFDRHPAFGDEEGADGDQDIVHDGSIDQIAEHWADLKIEMISCWSTQCPESVQEHTLRVDYPRQNGRWTQAAN